MNPGAVSSGVVKVAGGPCVEVVGGEDSLSVVVRKQEAALKRLEEKHGAGYGKPPPGSKSEARAKKYNESCTREILQLCGLVSEKGQSDGTEMEKHNWILKVIIKGGRASAASARCGNIFIMRNLVSVKNTIPLN